MRTNPQGFIPEIQAYLDTYTSDGVYRMINCNGYNIRMMTFEGKAPVEELITFL